MHMARALMVTLLLVSLSLAATAYRKNQIDAAIKEAKQAALQSSRTSPSRAAHALAAFKTAAPRLISQGNARVLFEDMVRRAEKKILESQQAALQASDTEARAEILAKELLHTPGSVLTEEETAMVYRESGCKESATKSDEVDCSDPAFKNYRTANGICNNLDNFYLGSAEAKFRRILPARYEDGIAQLRGMMQSMNVSVLPHDPFRPPYPSARIVSQGIVRDRLEEESQFSHILMQWGQWVDHDLDEAPQFDVSTCPPGCTIETDKCVPVPIPSDDDFSAVFGDPTAGPVCHPFARSVPVCDKSPPGQLGPREQLNALTPWIDGSQVYGSYQEWQDRLRNGSTAFMRTGDPIPSSGGASLPRADQSDVDNGLVGCPLPLNPSDCFLAGDVRVNEQISLTVFHTIFVREHNRIAEQLQTVNSEMDDETIFKLTREIVAAEIQKITYHDYLSIILGQRFFDENIKPYKGYNPRVDPTVPNAFAAAAYRFGHSQIRPVLDRLDVNFQNISAGPLSLAEAFFSPSQFAESEGTDPLLRGLISKPVRTVDEFVNFVLTTLLFQSDTSRMDLATLNIQRGRDHGIPPYLVWKKWATRTCGETSDFRNELTYIRLLQTYGSLDTVDLWVGGLAEEPVRGGLVGATFACIFANTFAAIRDGDRFYYENVKTDSNSDAFFTAEQRDEIEKASLSRIICDNSDNIQEIQPNAFRLDQPRVACSQIPSMNLSVFGKDQETMGCAVRIMVTTPNTNSILFKSESRPLVVSRPETIENVLSRQSTICVPFLCPKPGQQIQLSISTPDDKRCTEQDLLRNPGLPSRRPGPPFVYTANIGTNHIGTTTGAYESISACESGTVNGLFFTCPMPRIQSDKELIDSLEDALAQKETYERPKEDKNEKLIVLLEEYVRDLKNKPKQRVPNDN